MSNRTELLKKADIVFSRYIRDLYSDEQGFCSCITCGAYMPSTEIQNGHYIKRRHMAARFSVMNCHCQCQQCNNDEAHTDYIYREKMIELYGLEAVEGLERLKNIEVKYSESDLKEIIKKYKS